jgi:3-oxoacyl-[acyl-carrier-protein] synthase-1
MASRTLSQGAGSLASAMTMTAVDIRPATLAPVAVAAGTVACATGLGRHALERALREHRCALARNTHAFGVQPGAAIDTFVGEVGGLDDVRLPDALAALDCRNHRLAWLGLQGDAFAAAVAHKASRVGAARVGVVMGTTTSSIAASESAYRHLDAQGLPPEALCVHELHHPGAIGHFVQRALGVAGPAMTVSTACSSSAKAFAVAQRWLATNVCDAVVVGGADSLCGSVLHGFASLELVSSEPCRPFDAQRRGISIGEAAGYALMIREEDAASDAVRLLGVGESSDAHHLTAPRPDGTSIEAALREALARAGIAPDDVDYLNLHGTATPHNDAVEAAMLARVFDGHDGLHASSTKGCTGHTLGAAGIVEAVVCLLAIERGFRPGTVGLREPDAACGRRIRVEPSTGEVKVAVSHAFGFGGTNAVLVFGRP